MLASNGKRISRDNVTCFGANKCPWSRGPQSIIRVVDVWDINIKAEACNLHCGMICGHLLHDVDKLNQEQKKTRPGCRLEIFDISHGKSQS